MTVVKITELVGTSSKSWEEAAQNAVKGAAKTVHNITGVEILKATAKVEDGRITEYRSTVKIAFALTDR
ncbi:MAG: dodecin family protein [Bacillota bacterium]|jgi:dodecin